MGPVVAVMDIAVRKLEVEKSVSVIPDGQELPVVQILMNVQVILVRMVDHVMMERICSHAHVLLLGLG